MKNLYLLLAIGSVLVFVVACKRDLRLSPALPVSTATNDTQAQHGYTSGVTTVDTITPGAIIVGVWKIASDSTFRGAGLTNNAYNYQGQVADYFDFRTDGYVYTKENGAFDTLSYHLVADTGLYMANVQLDGTPKNFHISTFTTHKFVGATIQIATPGGLFGRKISLSK